jgi:hypothetical protein
MVGDNDLVSGAVHIRLLLDDTIYIIAEDVLEKSLISLDFINISFFINIIVDVPIF